MSEFFGLSRGGYYKSLNKEIKQKLSEEVIVQMVLEERRFLPRMGGKKLYFNLKKDLAQLNENIGRDKFFDILRNNGLLVKRKKKYVSTTDSHHRFHKHKSLIKGIDIDRPNQVYVSDITYVRLAKGGFVYLFLITDAFSRKIVGWHLSENLGIEGAVKALKMALKQCPETSKLIHHSDRGIQYCSEDYTKLLAKNKIGISMTEQNHCYENSLAERVNGILKQEFLLDSEFRDQKIAQKAVKQAVSSYNELRPHLSLDYQTPNVVHQTKDKKRLGRVDLPQFQRFMEKSS